MYFLSLFNDCEVTFLFLLEISDSRTFLHPSPLLSSLEEANLEGKSIVEDLFATAFTLQLLLNFSVLNCEANKDINVTSGLIRYMM